MEAPILRLIDPESLPPCELRLSPQEGVADDEVQVGYSLGQSDHSEQLVSSSKTGG